MSKPDKTKLCWNCEGSVSRTTENCPYCAVYLSPEEDSKASQASNIPKAPYTPTPEPEELTKEAAIKPAALQTLFLPLIFLTTGLIFFFFAFMLLLFSENGKLTLQWDGDFWYIYAILSFPLLILGWYYLNKSPDI